jgi:hypothetical protein
MGRVRVAIIAIGLLVGAGGLLRDFAPAWAPTVPLPAPSTGLLAGVESADARSLRDFYASMADIVVRDGLSDEPAVQTVVDLRNRHKQALAMAFAHTQIVGKYPSLGERIDEHLLKAIGDLDVPLTPDLRAKAAQAFSDVK